MEDDGLIVRAKMRRCMKLGVRRSSCLICLVMAEAMVPVELHRVSAPDHLPTIVCVTEFDNDMASGAGPCFCC